MIYGIGTDIAETSRFKNWVENSKLLNRFFNEKEIITSPLVKVEKLCEHYSSRFAAKEAYSKALGTGLTGFELKEICVLKTPEGQPYIQLEGQALEVFKLRCGKNAKIHLSLSHEKDYALAYTVIELI